MAIKHEDIDQVILELEVKELLGYKLTNAEQSTLAYTRDAAGCHVCPFIVEREND